MQESIEVSVSEDGTMTYSYGGWTWTVGTEDYETEGTLDAEGIIEVEQTEESENEEKETKEGAEADNTALTGTVVGINSYLNLRSGAGTDYKVIGKLTNGTEVEVIGEENGWYEIVIPEMTGYVYSGYLEVMETVTEEEGLDGMDSLDDLDGLDEMFLMALFSLLFQSDSTEEDTSEAALTPDGNLTLVDDIDTGTDADAGKQFITVTTRSGNYFYLIIDRDDEGEETVHFLNQVDESDLLSLMDEEDVAEYESSMSNYETETETEKVTQPVTEPETESIEEEADGENLAGILLILLFGLILAGGGGFFAYTRLRNKKEEEKKPDPDSDYDDEEEYDYSEDLSDDEEYADGDGSTFKE